MKPQALLLAAASVLLFVTDASAWPFPMLWSDVYTIGPSCVPFEAKDTPDEINRQWQYRGGEINYIRTKSGKHEVLREVQRYGTTSGLNLSVYKYAGETVFKAWACEMSADPATGERRDHQIAVLQNRTWMSAYAQRPAVWREYDSEGNLIELTFRLFYETVVDNVFIAERVVTLPRAWFVEPQSP